MATREVKHENVASRSNKVYISKETNFNIPITSLVISLDQVEIGEH